MAADKLTLKGYIDKFSACNYNPIKLSPNLPQIGISPTSDDIDINKVVVEFLNELNIETDVFVKFVDDKYFINQMVDKIKIRYPNEPADIHFITWVERPLIGCSDEPPMWSFWMFPVLAYQNNTMVDLINNAVSIVKFRRKLTTLYFGDNEKPINVTLVGDYPDEFTQMDDERSSITFIRRQTKIIYDHLEEIPFVNVSLIGHQYEQHLDSTDILILPNGLIGNAIYRAWFSTKLASPPLNYASFVIRKSTHMPLWVGRSIFDGDNPIEIDFAKACWNIKNNYLNKNIEL